MKQLRRYLPILEWGSEYTRKTFSADLVVAGIVTFMLIPQSLAYALLAGLPMQVGLYASIVPLILYALFGTSRTLAVGPVAVASLMTAAAVGQLAAQGTPEYLGAAVALAVLSGLMLIVMGLLRLGFLANFLSHPVIAGFITASGIQIATGQIAPVLGIHAHGHSFVEIVQTMLPNLGHVNPYTAAIGVGSLVFLFWVRGGLKPLLMKAGIGERLADTLAKVGPVGAIVVTTLAAWKFDLADRGVSIVGTVPSGLPSFTMPPLEAALWMAIVVPALLISIVGYVESISVALTLAA
ncbi:MAG: SulP family inorganic anion transporter, partial [Chromatiaceae bacterium]